MPLVISSHRRIFPGVGPVLLEKKKRTRYINIFVEPFKGVRVSYPYHVSLKEAEQFVTANISWIRKKQAAMKLVEKKRKGTRQLDMFTAVNKDEAKKVLTRRTRELAERFGLSCGRITVRSQKTRWGSCSPENNISLNMKLMRLPEDLRDYIILHELAHTRVKSHGVNFWALLTTCCPDARKLDKKMQGIALDTL